MSIFVNNDLNEYFTVLNSEELYFESEQKMIEKMAFFNDDPDYKVTAFIAQYIKERLPYPAPYLRIHYILEGSITAYLDGNIYNFEPGAIIFANQSSKIDLYARNDSTKVVTFLFKKTYFSNSLMNLLSYEQDFYKFFVENINIKKPSNNYAVLQFSKSDDIHLYTMIFLKQVIEKQGKDYKLTQAAFLLLINEVNKYTEKMVIAKEYSITPTLLHQEMITFIENNYNDINLKKLAQKFDFHPNYVSSLLKKETNKTFSDWVIEFRLQNASRYLLETNISIEKIIEDVGYNDKSFFFKIFKDKYGMSPQRFRKTNRDSSKEL